MSLDRFAPPADQPDASIWRWMKLYYWGLARSGKDRSRYVRKANLAFSHATWAHFLRELEANRNRVFVDLGANVGDFTSAVAPYASRVIAVEPDPWTADRFRANTAHLGNVDLVEAAVGVGTGEIRLHRPPKFAEDPELWSVGCTVVDNAFEGETVTIPQVDYAALLDGIEGEIGVVKIDIEGAEVDLLEHLLDERPDLLRRIGALFVETHEKQFPPLERRTRALRARLGLRRLLPRGRKPFVCMNWW